MMKNGKANKGFSKDGQTFAKDEVFPISDYSVQFPYPPNFVNTVQGVATEAKGAKRIELDPLDVELIP